MGIHGARHQLVRDRGNAFWWHPPPFGLSLLLRRPEPRTSRVALCGARTVYGHSSGRSRGEEFSVSPLCSRCPQWLEKCSLYEVNAEVGDGR